jgi:MoxR-like ATPase
MSSPSPSPPRAPGATISQDTLATIASAFEALRAELSRVYIGPAAAAEALLIALLARGHVLIEGVPGIAKTTLVKAFAQTLDCAFRRIQFTPDLLPSDITGTYILDRKAGEFVLRKGPIFANIVLGDEINRAPAKTQAALLEAMQEGQVTIEGQTLPLQAPFLVLATQNPVEQEGVYLLPEAQLDRFMFKMHMGYPSLPDEVQMLRAYAHQPEPVQPILHPDEVLAWAALAEEVTVRPELFDYIVRLVRFTREHKQVALGASPRASIALMRGARARALLHGRDYVLPDDVRALAPLILPHRVILQPEAEMSGQRSEQVVQAALGAVRYAAP